jgi:hypothetical protein
VVLASMAIAGCTGSIGNALVDPNRDDSPATGGGAVGNQDPAQPSCEANRAFAPPRLWRLNDAQYTNVVHDVFGSAITVPADVSEAVSAGAEDLQRAESLTIGSDMIARNYMNSAHATALSAVANLGGLLGCDAAAAGCVESFIKTKVAHAFRRPITDGETADMMALYQLGASDGPSEGARVLLEYVLQSPAFLWRTELAGVDPEAPSTSPVPLGPYELAGAMSFLFLDSAPDDGLWAKATAGTLTSPAVISEEVDRLMALPSVEANIATKVGSWLSIKKTEATVKDAVLFPEFTPAVRDALSQGAKMFLRDMVLDGKLSELITSHRMYLNQDLATIFGVPGVTGSSLAPVDVQLDERGGGILTQPAILAANSRVSKGDPVHRGLFVYLSMVCGSPPPGPPPQALAVDAALPADATERERATFRASNAQCQGCHTRFDPFGLLTERYDPIGRYHEKDASGKPIDQTATIRMGSSLDGPADGVGDLISRLRSSREFPDCASAKISAIAMGRTLADDNSCALRDVQDQFAKSESFIDLFKALATSPGFLTRDGRLQ